jgi:hypothetical protein
LIQEEFMDEWTYVFISGSRDADHRLLKEVNKAIKRCKEENYFVLLGDNPKGVDAHAANLCAVMGVPFSVTGIEGANRWQNPNAKKLAFAEYHSRDCMLAQFADRGLFYWNGSSRGTKAAFDYMNTLGTPCWLITRTAQGIDVVGTYD